MAFNHETLNLYQRMLPFNVKVGIWTGEWDSKHAICDQQNLLPRDEVVGWKALTGEGFGHDSGDDRRHSTMMQSTKLATKLATKKKSPGRTSKGEKLCAQ